jgi:hypothetical protein
VDASIGAAAIGAVPATFAAVLAYRAAMHGSRNAATLGVVQRQTNGELDRKIAGAVRDVFRENQRDVTEAVMAEALRDLLDGILEAASDDNPER